MKVRFVMYHTLHAPGVIGRLSRILMALEYAHAGIDPGALEHDDATARRALLDATLQERLADLESVSLSVCVPELGARPSDLELFSLTTERPGLNPGRDAANRTGEFPSWPSR